MVKEGISSIGPWAFILGLVLAILAGFVTSFTRGVPDGTIVLVLAVLGIIVGVLNVTDKETVPFLVSTLTFMLAASSLNVVFAVIPYMAKMSEVMTLISVFVAPAGAVVAIKALYGITKER